MSDVEFPHASLFTCRHCKSEVRELRRYDFSDGATDLMCVACWEAHEIADWVKSENEK